MKIVKDDFNVTSNLRYELQRATLIADDFELKEVNTGALILAMLKDDYSKIQELYAQTGIVVSPDYIIAELLDSKEEYERIFNQDFPFGKEESKSSENSSEISKENLADIIKNDKELNLSEEEANDLSQQIEISFYPQFQGFNYDIPYSKNLKQAIFDAGNRCRKAGKDYIDEENLLYSIFNIEDCSAQKILGMIHQDIAKSDIEFDIIDLTDELINNYSICFSNSEDKLVIPKPLESCCTILNDKYEKGIKCDILGRDEELFELWGVLSKKQKSNAVLVGEAGVGKSAVVEALTMSIVNGTCPEKFKNYKVVELNVSGMVAGTKYRGEFEKKVEHLVNFISNYDNLIIFVDEMHHIMGAGSAEGTGPDLSGSLKPILARDKVKFIGATTMAEYEMYICRDNAFRRRLEPIEIEEPKQSEVLQMLKVKIENLKKFHGVTISKKVLEYIQLCAACFNTSTCNPDKTLDLIDRSMAIAANVSKSVKIEHVNRVFSKNYKKYDKNSNEQNVRTAYHEAGHFISHVLLKDMLVDMEVYALSVIPGFGFLGANILETTEVQPKRDIKYFEAKIASLISGRIAEEIFFNEKTAGASNDLGKASSIARNMILNYGLSSNGYKNFSVFDNETGNTLPFSEKSIDDINKEAKEFVDIVYKSTTELLSKEENKAKIDIVAKTLLKKKIVSAKELEEIISKM